MNSSLAEDSQEGVIDEGEEEDEGELEKGMSLTLVTCDSSDPNSIGDEFGEFKSWVIEVRVCENRGRR